MKLFAVLLVLLGSWRGHVAAQPGAGSVTDTITAIRAAAEKLRAENPAKLLTVIADIRPTSERCHVVFRDSDGSYVRVWIDGKRDQNFTGPDPLLDGLKPREAGVVYMTLQEVTGEYSRVLYQVMQHLSTAWGTDFSRSLFHIMMVDKAKYPERYSQSQKFVLGVATPDSLVDALRSPDRSQRRSAALGLRVLRETAAAPHLAARLDDEDIGVRTAATGALLAFGTSEATTSLLSASAKVLPSLRQLLEDDKGIESPPLDALVTKTELRARALAVAARMGEPAADILLAHWPDGRGVRQDVTATLLAMGDAGSLAMNTAERGTHAALRIEAANALRAREAAERAAAKTTVSDREAFIAVVSRVLARRINKDELAKLGPTALTQLTTSLRVLEGAEVGQVSLALAELGPLAKMAIPTLIDVFPLEPRSSISIDVTTRIRAQQKSKRDPKVLAKELQDSYGIGELVSMTTGVFVNNRIQGPMTYQYNVNVAAGAAALYRISGEIPGVTQIAWQRWLARQKVRSK